MNAATKAPPDFPDWLGPMLVKELRQGLKARAFVLTFIGLQIVLVLVTIYHALLYAKHPQGFDGNGLSAVFWMLIAVQLLVITPARALNALANERKANTLELIFMSGLTPWRIAWGKWASLMFQAVLFLLAVLPYAILRYFFGGMNLTDELMSLVGALLFCAVFTAVAIGISGLPLPVRVLSFCVAGFLAMSVLPMLLFGVVMRSGSSGPFSSVSTLGYGWLLVIYNALLLIIGAIEVAAATISPPADNGAMRQRILALLAWVPVPIIFSTAYGVGASTDVLWAQIGIACGIAGLLCWQHLSVPADVMRSHLEPYRRAARGAPFVGALFLPGWPSAVLFLVLAEALAVASIRSIHAPIGSQREMGVAVTTALLMGGASFMVPPLLWQIIRRRPRWPLAEYTIFLVLVSSLASFHEVLRMNSVTRAGHHFWVAVVPPVAFWTMFDGGMEAPYLEGWFAASLIAFSVCATGLLLFSGPYWKRAWQLSRAVRTPVKPTTVSLPAAA